MARGCPSSTGPSCASPCYELLYREDVPPGAVISQAVEAAKELSTEDSSRFVNGVLGKIARERTEVRGVLG